MCLRETRIGPTDGWASCMCAPPWSPGPPMKFLPNLDMPESKMVSLVWCRLPSVAHCGRPGGSANPSKHHNIVLPNMCRKPIGMPLGHAQESQLVQQPLYRNVPL